MESTQQMNKSGGTNKTKRQPALMLTIRTLYVFMRETDRDNTFVRVVISTILSVIVLDEWILECLVVHLVIHTRVVVVGIGGVTRVMRDERGGS